MPEPKLFTAADLRSGLQAEFERDITAEDIRAFAELSGDWNPLHTDEEYARQSNYGRRIAHGAFQVGLASTMAGMYLPGRNVVVGSFQCRFPAPLHYPSRVRVHGEITTWVPQSTSGTLRVQVVEETSGILTSEIRVGFGLHETHLPNVEWPTTRERRSQVKPVVIMTGAGGAIGREIAQFLSESYGVIGVARRLAEADSSAGIERATADLTKDDWESQLVAQLNGRRIFGLVHAAWPTASQGGLLDTDLIQIRAHVEFGTVGIVRIARFLRSQASHDGARLIVLGSTAGSVKPVLNMAAYSLGKAALEHTVQLLAPELARTNITVNVIAPSFLPVGMNSTKTNRVVLTETAKVPLGRLCSTEDVSKTVEFLLSPGAGFITGQVLPLTGGQL